MLTQRLRVTALLFALLSFALASAQKKDSSEKEIAIPKPSEIEAIVRSIGLHTDIAWRKSKIEEGWTGQYRAFNGQFGKNLNSVEALRYDPSSIGLNEVTVTLTGKVKGEVTKVRIEAEIYKPQYEQQTMDVAVKSISKLFPECPPEVVDAFKKNRKLKLGSWRVIPAKHEVGHDVFLIYCVDSKDWEVEYFDTNVFK